MRLGLITVVLAALSASCFAQGVFWMQQPGAALHLSGNASGELWAIGTQRIAETGFEIARFRDGNWQKVVGAGRRLAVDPKGDVWMVDEMNYIFRLKAGSANWEVMPGLGQDIAAGGDGSIWLIGVGRAAGGFGIHKWNGSGWTNLPGAAVRIAAERDGTAWVVDQFSHIHRYNAQTNSWELKPGLAHSVYAGATSGAVWMLGAEDLSGGHPVYRWNASTGAWDEYSSRAATSVAEANGVVWVSDADGSVASGIGAITVSEAPLTLNPSGPIEAPPMPPLTPTETLPVIVGQGKMLCSTADAASLTAYCGDTKADYVGAYSLTTFCARGFYDPIYGGSCWTCPANDGNGEWLRSLDAVDKDTACWRIPKETLSRATKVKSPGWAWECPSGSFWDGYSPDGIGGSCWSCPASHPRRTANHVAGGEACASAINETRPATLLSFAGCPNPDKTAMGLPGRRTPGKPFLDIAAGWHQGVVSGGCYACPVMDEEGNFLVTERNGKPIYDKDNNTGCRIHFKWKPGSIPQSGLSGLAGVKELIWEKRLFEGGQITTALYEQAQARNLGNGTEQAKLWVADRWKEIAAKPYSSDPFRVHIFALLKVALMKAPGERTEAERKLIKSFADYIRFQRVFLAQQGLAMYDSWKEYDDKARAARKVTTLESMFYYGTVPLDFDTTLQSVIALGSTGGGVLGSLYAMNRFSAGVLMAGEQVDLSTSMYGLSKGLNLFKAAHGGSLVAGASVISVAGAILSSIAIERFVAIETARPKLEASLKAADQEVDLDKLAAEPNGEDMLYYWWARAMNATEREDEQVVSTATAAHKVAQLNGYAKPIPGVILDPAAQDTLFRLTKSESVPYTDIKFEYITWDKSKWTATLKQGVFTHTPASGSPSHTDKGINYLTWDNTRWNAVVLADGKTFRHTSSTGEVRESSGMKYLSWSNDGWELAVEKPSPQR